MKKMHLFLSLIVLCGCLAFAQDTPGGQMTNPNDRASADANTIEGCLTGSDGNYMLIQKDTGTTYNLRGSDHRLGKHVGQEVAISGRLKRGAASESPTGTEGPTLTARYINTISKQCKMKSIAPASQ
jgi:hypothetical protein